MHYVIKQKKSKEVMIVNIQIVATVSKGGKGVSNWEEARWRGSGVTGKILSSDVGGWYKGFRLMIIH